MCGIAGYVGERKLDERALDGTLALMHRRGPDHRALRCFRTPAGRYVYLLNSRLSIIDLDPRSNQPFHAGSTWVTYNGELYNYVELRNAVEAAGHTFETTSDTEVLTAAVDRLGWRALDRFEGMWAVAAYDESDGTVTLARDRFGEKPLYVYRDGTGLYFGSEPKCIAALLGRRLPVNLRQLYRYLAQGYRALYQTGETFFEGVLELRPGTLLRVEADGRETRRRYWSLTGTPDESMEYGQAVAGVRERLVRSVERRLRADVPLAFCMSGGVDSNALISIAKNACGYDVHGFTIVNTDGRYDERPWIDEAVRTQDLRHTAVPAAAGDFVEGLRELVRYHDAPVYTITYLTHWRLMERIAADGYRIAVSGTGADELLTGYYDHHLLYLAEIQDDAARHAEARRCWEARIRPLVRNPLLRDADLFVREPAFRDHLTLDADRFAAALVAPFREPFVEHRYTSSLLRNRMLNELFHEVVPVILHEDDLNAMFHSIENRSPYLDRELCEFCHTIPSRYLVRDGLAKAVLRDAMRGIVPQPILDNPRKVGFNAPIDDLFDRRDPDARAWLLADAPLFAYVRRDSVRALLDEPQLPNSRSKFLFSIVNAKLFLEEFAA
jgi:asparagine synthase (glutamine-hydrolysing)